MSKRKSQLAETFEEAVRRIVAFQVPLRESRKRKPREEEDE
jgi:hypothetical protein